MLDLFGKIDEFFKNIMIDVIKDNLSAMLLDINEKVGTVAGEVGKTPSSWNSEVFAFIKSINENVVLPIAVIILTAICCIELIQVVMQKNSMHDVVFYKRSYSNYRITSNIKYKYQAYLRLLKLNKPIKDYYNYFFLFLKLILEFLMIGDFLSNFLKKFFSSSDNFLYFN